MDSAPPTQAGAVPAVLQHTGAGARTLKLPTGLASPPSITVHLPAGEPVSDALTRLFVVAARVFASRLEQIRALSSARAETESLRAMAVGSARAFLGTSPAAAHVARVVPRLAASDAGALLLGESGVGQDVRGAAHPRARARAPPSRCA